MPVPKGVLPSINVTVPVGVPPNPVTFTMNVTDVPAWDGLGLEVLISVVVAAVLTVWVSVPVLVGEFDVAAIDRRDRMGARRGQGGG